MEAVATVQAVAQLAHGDWCALAMTRFAGCSADHQSLTGKRTMSLDQRFRCPADCSTQNRASCKWP